MESAYSPDPVLLPGVLHAYGERWQIARDGETAAWTAVERPSPTALHVVVAFSVGELAEKLAKQEGHADTLDVTAQDFDPGAGDGPLPRRPRLGPI